ncbi:MAG TPA: hypothetical protein VFC77_09300, partial [Myxococcota bacterium]|nr:hypothetical protein [Myxococcota bacterium]
MDGLTEYIRNLPPERALEVLPQDLPALARLFPVLNQFLSPSETVREVPDLQELRRRAARALRELLAELGRSLDLVVFIDDLQWGDTDSAPLLLELLDGPEPPRLLLVVSYRSEDAGSAVLQPLLALGARGGAGIVFREISVGELSAGDARGLARELVGTRPGADEDVERLVGEAGGNPFFLQELARAGAASGLRLDDLLRRRVDRLSEPERRLLEVVSVAGEPIERRVAAEAAGLGGKETAVVARLRTGHFLRESVAGGVESIAAYHDRLRETLVAALAPEARRDLHRVLAAAMERGTRRDAERMSIHFRGAGDMDRASRYARDAADRAAQALAFDRAARLYRLALEHPALDEVQAIAVRASLAEALANAGRNREAAQAYLAAARNVAGTAAIELRRCAAEQFLRGGYASEGLDVVRAVLGSLGLSLPASRPQAILRLLLLRLRIRLRGLDYEPRAEAELSAEERIRIDACWSVTFCLGFVDYVLAGYLQARNLLWALEAGEPYRVALALLGEAAYTSPGGNRSREATLRVLDRATRLAERVNRPHSTALVSLTAGVAANYAGRWRECAEKTGEAERIFREQCTGVAHELANAIYWRLWALSQCGRLMTLKRELPLVLKDAYERGDLYLSTNVRLRGGYLVALADDDPDAATAEIDAAMKGWTFIRISNQHVWEMFDRAHVSLYRGEGLRAWETFASGRWLLRTTLM